MAIYLSRLVLGDDTNDDIQQKQISKPSPENGEVNGELDNVDNTDGRDGRNTTFNKWTEDKHSENESRPALPKISEENISSAKENKQEIPEEMKFLFTAKMEEEEEELPNQLPDFLKSDGKKAYYRDCPF